MNKQYTKEEKKQQISECKEWVHTGKSVKSFAEKKGIPRGTMYTWVKVREIDQSSPKPTIVHIPKVQKVSSQTPLLVEMR